MKTTVGTGNVDDFFSRGRELARDLDAGGKVPETIVITFEKARDFLEVMTPQRHRVMEWVAHHPGTIRDISDGLRRNQDAIRKDIKLLAGYGILSITKKKNPGHGVVNWIEPVAGKIELRASI